MILIGVTGWLLRVRGRNGCRADDLLRECVESVAVRKSTTSVESTRLKLNIPWGKKGLAYRLGDDITEPVIIDQLSFKAYSLLPMPNRFPGSNDVVWERIRPLDSALGAEHRRIYRDRFFLPEFRLFRQCTARYRERKRQPPYRNVSHFVEDAYEQPPQVKIELKLDNSPLSAHELLSGKDVLPLHLLQLGLHRSGLRNSLTNHMLSLANSQGRYKCLILRSLSVPVGHFEQEVRNETANYACDEQSNRKEDDRLAGCCLSVLGVSLPRFGVKQLLFIVLLLAILFGSLTCLYLFRSFDTTGRIYYWRFVYALGLYVIGHGLMWLMASWVYCVLYAQAHSDSRPVVNVSSLSAPSDLARTSARLRAAS